MMTLAEVRVRLLVLIAYDNTTSTRWPAPHDRQ
jgi:hypothetical protein